MDTFLHILKVIGLILLVLLSFNIIIFVHELGHFLAAKWRGLQVDRFQIWFGKPIWKKTIGGDQYALGSIPAGGFVALPQMAPMEAIEGENSEPKEALPPVKPLDKIIVAFAGPLFSFLLAVFAAVIVWGIGLPDHAVDNQHVGFILPDSPAEKAGFQLGDKIIEVEGEPVSGFTGELNSITYGIIFSEGDEIDFKVIRAGQEITLTSSFKTEEGDLLQRDGMRKVGIGPAAETILIGSISKGSPAEFSGFKIDDQLKMINGKTIFSVAQFITEVHKHEAQPIIISVIRDGKPLDIKTMPLKPSNGWKQHDKAEVKPMLGIGFKTPEKPLDHPTPGKQLKNSAMTMFTTIKKLTSSESSVGIQHLSGPVGIGKVQYQLLDSPHPINYIFMFWVLFNVNLAIFNLLPFPVLDGGHIVMAVGEMVRKKPLNTRILETVQFFFVMVLLSLFVYVTMKDLFSNDSGDKLTFETIPKEGPVYDLTPLKKAQ